MDYSNYNNSDINDNYLYTIEKNDTIGKRLNNIFIGLYFLFNKVNDDYCPCHSYDKDTDINDAFENLSETIYNFFKFASLYEDSITKKQAKAVYKDYSLLDKPYFTWGLNNESMNTVNYLYYPFDSNKNNYNSDYVNNLLTLWKEILNKIIAVYTNKDFFDLETIIDNKKEYINNANHYLIQLENIYT